MNEGFDAYMLAVARSVARNSKCRSKRIGAVLVRDKAVISTGYNGPPRGVPHCGDVCPRRAQGYESGEGLDLCPATHAEANAVVQAARSGVSTAGATLYLAGPFAPCKGCAGILVNAGIAEVVTESMEAYDEKSAWILEHGGVRVRRHYATSRHIQGIGE